VWVPRAGQEFRALRKRILGTASTWTKPTGKARGPDRIITGQGLFVVAGTGFEPVTSGL
jgi:hypothetical protein